MGTPNFFKKHAMPSQGLNMEARAMGASGYAARAAGTGAQKALATAMGATKSGLKATTKDAASNAPGPKRT
jgi:hypothetical protein